MENKFIKCPNCNKAIPTNSNYCYLCGEAVSKMSKDNEKLKKQNAELMLLNRLASVLTDEKDLEILKGIIFQIKNNY